MYSVIAIARNKRLVFRTAVTGFGHAYYLARSTGKNANHIRESTIDCDEMLEVESLGDR